MISTQGVAKLKTPQWERTVTPAGGDTRGPGVGNIRTILVSAIALFLILPVASGEPAAPPGVGLDPPVLPDAENATMAWATITVATLPPGAEASGALLLEGTTKPEKGYEVVRVGIWVDHGYLGDADGIDDWRYLLDTTRLVDGAHRLTVVAYTKAIVAMGSPLTLGWPMDVDFSTLNHQAGVVLYEHTYHLTGAMPEAWTHLLDDDYTGLRVTLTTAGGAAIPRGQIVVAYRQVMDEDGSAHATAKTWVGAFGTATTGAVLSKPPHDVLREGGLLALSGGFAGSGHVTLRIEALPLAPAAAT